MSASHSLNIPRGECASSSCKTEMMRDSEIFLLNIALDSYNNCEDNLFRKKNCTNADNRFFLKYLIVA
jgi:hypothetical protein